MSDSNILDRILTQRHAEEIRTFDPVAVVQHLLEALTEREREVVRSRYGIPHGVPRETLEEIGKRLKVTRERVRQITRAAIDKLRALHGSNAELKQFIRTTEYPLRCYGGTLEEDFFIGQLLTYTQGSRTTERDARVAACLRFLLDEAIAGFVEQQPAQGRLKACYVLTGAGNTLTEETVKALEAVVYAAGTPQSDTAMLAAFREGSFYREHHEALVMEPVRISREFYGGEDAAHAPTVEEENRVLKAYLVVAAAFGQNIFGEWGMATWPTIRPRRMNDKIYLVLRHEGKPLHFAAISEMINAARFDKKVAKAPSVHNELILDNRFVLVGRGTYALREWGYQPGTVADVVTTLLTERGPLSRDEIVAEVLRRRMVKRQTIHLALLNHTQFTKQDDGTYVPADKHSLA